MSGLISCTSCRKEAPIGPSTTVVVSFKTVYGELPFLPNQPYNYPSEGIVEFENFSLFMTDISLVTANGEDEIALDDIEYLDVSSIQFDGASASKGWVKAYFSVPLGDYSGIKFGLGVGHEENEQNPSDFAAENPLGVKNRYSDEFESYIFENISGQYYSGGNTTNFHISVLKNEMFKEVKLDKSFSITSSGGNVNVTLDLEKVFQRNDSIMDLSTNSLITAPTSPYMGWLSENLQRSFTF